MNIFRRVTVFAKQHRLITLFMYCVANYKSADSKLFEESKFIHFSISFENLKIIIENFDPGSICFVEGL